MTLAMPVAVCGDCDADLGVATNLVQVVLADEIHQHLAHGRFQVCEVNEP